MSQKEELKKLYAEYRRDDSFNNLREMSGVNFVGGYGPFNPSLMLVGAAPGKYENLKRVPFVGPNSKYLDVILEEVGFNRRSIFTTNVVKYWPLDPVDRGRTRPFDELTIDEIDITCDYLKQEIEIVDPMFVGLCGRPAIQSIFPDITEVFKYNGQLLDEKYVALYHPAVVAYDKEKYNLVKDGFVKLHDYIERSENLKAS